MKTFYALFVLNFFALNLIAQQPPVYSDYKVVNFGEGLLAKDSVDATIAYGKKTLEQTKPDAFEERQALFVLGRACLDNNDSENAIPYLRKSIALSLKEKDEFLLERSMISYAAALADSDDSKLDSSAMLLEGALGIATRIKDTLGMAKVYRSYSNVYYVDGEYEQAITYNQKFEDILRNSKGYEKDRALNQYAKANSLMEIYNQKEKNADLLEAKKAYEYAINTFHQLMRFKHEAHARNAYAGCLLYFAATDSAEYQAKESIKLGLSLQDNSVLLNGYYTLSNLYEMKADAESLKMSLEKVREYLVRSGKTSDYVFIQKVFSPDASRTSLSQIDNRLGMVSREVEYMYVKRISITGLLLLVLLFIYLHRERKLGEQKRRLLETELENLTQTRKLEYMTAKLEGEEQGRHKIARQIHDGVGGLLISTKWNLESALEELPVNEQKVSTRLKENLRLQEYSYQELRRVMYQLEQTDLIWWESLEGFCQQLSSHKKVNIQFYPYNLDESTQYIGEEIRLVIQELVTNALKHANATEISIQVSQIDNELDIIVEDNGKGFDKLTVTKGIGLKSIEERVKRLGGNYNIESGSGAGAIVFIDVPLKRPEGSESTSLNYASVN